MCLFHRIDTIKFLGLFYSSMVQNKLYECPIDGEVNDSDEVIDVEVHRVQTEGHSHFSTGLVGSVSVCEEHVHPSVINIELLVLFGNLIAVHRDEKTYGRSYDPDGKHVENRKKWDCVVDAVLDSE
jgi:hypothetical protein